MLIWWIGSCTSYKEKLCYHGHRVSSKKAVEVSWLLSELADQPKQGVLFNLDDWNRFRKDVVGSTREFPAPAYKTGLFTPRPNRPMHIIDYLMCQAKDVVDKSLTDLHRFLKLSGASTRDHDVEGHWDSFERVFGDISAHGRPRCTWFLALRDGLKADVEACLRVWNGLMSGPGDMDYREKVGHAHAVWRAIKPRLPDSGPHRPDPSLATVRNFLGADRPASAAAAAAELCPWDLLKASWAFKLHHQKRFVWQMAGRQLQAIKALRAADGLSPAPSGDGVMVPVVANMYAALRPDNAYIKRLMAMDGDDEVVSEVVPSVAGMAMLQDW